MAWMQDMPCLAYNQHPRSKEQRVPHCLRFLAIQEAQRLLGPRSVRLSQEGQHYFQRGGSYVYETKPLAMQIDELRENNKRRLGYVQETMDSVKKLIIKDSSARLSPPMNVDVMKRRMLTAKYKSARDGKATSCSVVKADPGIQGQSKTRGHNNAKDKLKYAQGLLREKENGRREKTKGSINYDVFI